MFIRFITGLLAILAVAGTALADRQAFHAELTGAEEVPQPVMTDTTGKASFKVNRKRTRIAFRLRIKDGNRILAGPGGHLHCAPFGENGPVVAFLAGGMPVGYNGTVRIRASLDDGSIVNDRCGATIDELVDSMNLGLVYVNIHSAANPGGEIRGQVYATSGHDDDSDSDSD